MAKSCLVDPDRAHMLRNSVLRDCLRKSSYDLPSVLLSD